MLTEMIHKMTTDQYITRLDAEFLMQNIFQYKINFPKAPAFFLCICQYMCITINTGYTAIDFVPAH